jgi:lauroyl/myristoyl acyltransferase
MESFLNGGRIRYFEKNLNFFYKSLKRGDAVLTGGDLPQTMSLSTSLEVPFLGKNRKMAAGPLHMAKKTNCYICAFSCLYQKSGQYHMKCSPLYPTTDDQVVTSFEKAYDFMSETIFQNPERWWTSDLMRHYT